MRGVAAEAGRHGHRAIRSGGVHGGAPHIRALLVLALAALVLLLAPGSGSAHTDLVSTDPADEAVLRRPPKQIVLTFTQAPLDQGLAVRVSGPSGSFGLPARVDGPQVVAAWPSSAESGQYRVNFRVVAEDGHPIEGRLTFRVAGARQQSPTPTQTAGPAIQPDASESAPGSPAPWLWVAGAAAVAAAVLLILRLGRAHDEGEQQ